MLLSIYLSLCAVSNVIFGLHLVRRGRDKIEWLESMCEDYDVYHRNNLFYQAAVGYQDLEDWLEWRFSELRKARRIAHKKSKLMKLRKYIRKHVLESRKLRREEEACREKEIRRLNDAMDRAGNRRANLSTGCSLDFSVVATLLMVVVFIASAVVATFGVISIALAVFVVAVSFVLLISDGLFGDPFDRCADISADVIGRIMFEYKEEVAEEDLARPVRTQKPSLSKKVNCSTVDAELRMVRNRNRKKRRK